MYLERFRLIRKPFNISSDPDFLWLGHCHGMALSALTRAVDRGGVMVLTGDVGTGKTTLLNTIVQGLPARVRTARIVDPCLELHQLFSAIAQDLGFELQRDEPFDTAFAQFLETVLLLKEHCLVVVDEAQRIGVRFLKVLFSWQELGHGRLPITVFFVGQNEFPGVLSTLEDGRFLEKMTLHQVLVPLGREETADYVRYRMSNAGAGEEVFLETALDRIYVFSGGYPRVINSLCDRCLSVAHIRGRMIVDEPLVQSAARQVLLPQESDSFFPEENETGETTIPGRRFGPMVCGFAVFLASVFVPPLLFDDLENSGLPEPGAYFEPGSQVLPVPDFQGNAQTVFDAAFKPVESRVIAPLMAPGDDLDKENFDPEDTIRSEIVEAADPGRKIPDLEDTTRPEIVEAADPGRKIPDPEDTTRYETVEGVDTVREVPDPDPGDVINWLLERK